MRRQENLPDGRFLKPLRLEASGTSLRLGFLRDEEMSVVIRNSESSR